MTEAGKGSRVRKALRRPAAVFLDTNVLLTATTPARRHHRRAIEVISAWPMQGVELRLSGQVIREYLVVATRTAEQNGLGLALGEAAHNARQLAARCRLLDEDAQVNAQLLTLLDAGLATGKQIHDANIIATLMRHRTSHLLTEDGAHFKRFQPQIEVIDLSTIAV